MPDNRVSSLTAVAGADILAADVLYLEHSSSFSSAQVTVANLGVGLAAHSDLVTSSSVSTMITTEITSQQLVGSASLATAIAEFRTSNSISSQTASLIAVTAVPLATSQLTGGYWATITDDGTVSAGTYTPFTARTGSNFRRVINGGAFTLDPPTATSSAAIVVSLLVVNAATSAGAVTTTPFDAVTGDSFDTTANNEFLCRIDVFNDGSAQYSSLDVVALQ